MKRIYMAFLSLFIVLLLAAFPVFANESKNVVLPASETVDHDYFGAGENVTVSGVVNGDAYVAGGTVVIDGTINGDLLTAGGTVTIAGNIQGDVRTAGGNISVSGAEIGGNVTAGGGQITIDRSTVIQGSIVGGGGSMQIFAPIGRGATVGGGTVLLANKIGGDVTAGTGQLTLSSGAEISGNLTYWSENKASISEGATISGTIKQEIPPKDKDGEAAAKGIVAAFVGLALFFKISEIAATVIIGVIVLLLFPVFVQKSSEVARGRFWTALLVGFFAVILIPTAGVILLITIFGIPLAILLFIFFVIELWVAKLFSMVAIGDAVLTRTKTKVHPVVAFVLGLIIFELLSLIPVIGWILQIAAVLTGFGSLLILKREYYLTLRSKKQI
jgi:hypothetical protein